MKLPSISDKPFATKKSIGLLKEAVKAGAHLAICSVTSTRLLAATKEKLYCVNSPRVEVINPYGAGDCLMATLAITLRSSKRVSFALKTAVSAALASVQTPVPGLFDLNKAQSLAKQIQITSAPLR